MFNPFFPNIIWLLLINSYWNRYWIPTENLYLSKSFRRPIFFQNCSPYSSSYHPWPSTDPAEIRCRIFSFHKGLPLLSSPQTWNLLKIKNRRDSTADISQSAFTSSLGSVPPLTPSDSGVLREGLTTQHKLTRLEPSEEDEVEELSCRQSSMPRNPQGCLYPALTKSEFEQLLLSCELPSACSSEIPTFAYVSKRSTACTRRPT